MNTNKAQTAKNIAKNIGIASEYAANVLKTQAIILSYYVLMIGVLYLCGIYPDSKVSQFFWKVDKNWAASLQQIVNGENSAAVQLTIIFLDCIIYLVIATFDYICSIYSRYEKHRMYITIVATGATIILTLYSHGNISLDDMFLIFIASCFFRVLSGILLKLTGTQTMFYRLNTELFTKEPQENKTNATKDTTFERIH